jgi:hypothetical protein
MSRGHLVRDATKKNTRCSRIFMVSARRAVRCLQPVGLEVFATSNMLILLRFVFLEKDEKPNDINGRIVKSDRLLVDRFFGTARIRGIPAKPAEVYSTVQGYIERGFWRALSH